VLSLLIAAVGVVAAVLALHGVVPHPAAVLTDMHTATAGWLAVAAVAEALSMDMFARQQRLWLVCLPITVAAIAGDQFGYASGKRLGPTLFRRPNSRVFKQENLVRAQGFFDKYGARAIVLVRFVPIVRTFTPIVAGASRMNYRTFTINAGGGLLWGTGITVLGYFLGQIAFVKSNIEFILAGIVVISIVPIAWSWMRR